MADGEEPLSIPIPERLDRPLRLGPFASARAAAKFVTAVAIGAVVGLAVGPWAGLPIAAIGGLVVLWRPGGEPLDGRLAAAVRWAARRREGRRTMTGGSTGRAPPRTWLRLEDGRPSAILRTGGVPLAFLPPDELARRFAEYRQLLNGLDAGLVVLATSAPVHAGALAPVEPAPGGEERAARNGYRELVGLIARRRSLRRVVLAVVANGDGLEGLARLESAVARVRERLGDLGIPSERLRDRSLAEAAARLGIPEEGPRR